MRTIFLKKDYILVNMRLLTNHRHSQFQHL